MGKEGEKLVSCLLVVAVVVQAVAGADTARACLSTDVLAGRIGNHVADADGLAKFFRAAQLCVSEAPQVDSAAGLDVPRPIEADSYACNTHSLSPDWSAVQLQFRHDASPHVDRFLIVRERVGAAEDPPRTLELNDRELSKCRSKRVCTFEDKVVPENAYIYTVRAVNAAGESDTVEIRCDVEASYVSIAASDDETDCNADGKQDEMNIHSALFMTLSLSLLSAGSTAFFMYRSSWVLEAMKKREDTQLDAEWIHRISRFFPWICVASANFSWFAPNGLFGHHKIMPVLDRMVRKSRDFTGLAGEHDQNNDGRVSLVELQLQAQVQIVAPPDATYEQFVRSKIEWIRALNSLQFKLRKEADELLDGDPVTQPQLIATFVICCIVVSYACLLARVSRDLWMAEDGKPEGALQNLLEPKSLFRPGYAIGLAMLPMVLHQLWTSYAVVSTAMRIAAHMNGSVQTLRKIQHKLTENGLPNDKYNVLDTVKDYDGKRWGVRMCGYAIDEKFWSHFSHYCLIMFLCAIFLVPSIVVVRAWFVSVKRAEKERQRAEKEKADKDKAHEQRKLAEKNRREAEDAQRQAEQLRQEALKEARSEAERAELAEQQRQLEELAKIKLAKERDLLKESERLVDFSIRSEDLTVMKVDKSSGYRDWRKCLVNGEHLGHKEFEAKGAAGEVRRAMWQRTTEVAIKVMLSDSAMTLGLNRTSTQTVTTPQGRLKLPREMKLFLDLNHPHVVRCYGILLDKGVNMLVTELCETSLDAFLKYDRHWEQHFKTKQWMTQELVDKQKFDVLMQIASGLHRLHELKVLHKDIKTGNILLGKDKTWKICDFGEAKTFDSALTTVVFQDDNFTAEIASPELISQEPVGLPSDVYAFAIVMWEVLTRQVAWHWLKGAAIQMAVMKQVAMNKERPRVPDSLAQDCREIIQMSLHHEPKRRPNMDQLKKWLLQKAHHQNSLPRAISYPPEPVPRRIELPRCRQNQATIAVPGIITVEQAPVVPVPGCRFEVRCTRNQTDFQDLVTVTKCVEDSSVDPDEEEARWLFNQIDEDSNGSLDRDELRNLLNEAGAGHAVTEQELAVEFNKMDKHNDGEILFENFKEWWIARKSDDSAAYLRRHVTNQHNSTASLPLQQVADGWSNTLQIRCMVKPGWLIAGRGGQEWNTRGKWIGAVGTRSNVWQEPALHGHEQWVDVAEDTYNDDDSELAPGLFRTILGDGTQGAKLGVVFGERWPCVKRLDAGSPVVAATPQIRVGCRLVSINGEPTDGMAFKEAVPKTKLRPLEFIWKDLLVEADFSTEGDLGLVFADAWPNIKKIKPGSLADGVYELQAGCKLLSINGMAVEGMELKQVGPLVAPRPVKMVFSQPRATKQPQQQLTGPRGQTRSAPRTIQVDRFATIPEEVLPQPQDAFKPIDLC